MSAETAFWESITGQASHGWATRTEDFEPGASSRDPSAMALSDMTVNVYVVAPASAWIGAGATSPAQVEPAAQAMQPPAGMNPNDHRQLVTDSVLSHIAACGSSGVVAGDPDLKRAISGAMAVLTSTRTFQAVKAAMPSAEGHWFYVCYQLHDGTFAGRPAYIGSRVAGGNGVGMLPADEVHGFLRQLIERDLTDRSGSVYKMIQDGGGVTIAGDWQSDRVRALQSVNPTPSRPRSR